MKAQAIDSQDLELGEHWESYRFMAIGSHVRPGGKEAIGELGHCTLDTQRSPEWTMERSGSYRFSGGGVGVGRPSGPAPYSVSSILCATSHRALMR